jgi:hypothetical protein
LPPETLSLHVPLLIRLIRDRDKYVRASAFDTLYKMEPAELAKIPTEELLSRLSDRDYGVRRAVIGTLCRLPLEVLAPHAARVMLMLWDPERSVRKEAMEHAEEMRIQFGAAPQLMTQLRRAALEACVTAWEEAVAEDLMH